MAEQLENVKSQLEIREIRSCETRLYRVCKIAREISDHKLTFFAFKLMGLLYLYTNQFKNARSMFEIIRDSCSAGRLWTESLEGLRWIGVVFEKMLDYEHALICYKRMMQLSWITRNSEYENLSYGCIASAYFKQ